MRVYMHAYVQKFVSADLKPMVDKADKKGRPVGNFLKAIADLVADYTTAAPTRSVRKAMKELQSEKGHNARFVAPGAAQLHLLRCMVRSMNDLNGRGHYVSDSKDKVTMAVLEAFHTDTHYFPYMQSLSSTVQACNHLGDLWYRELFIEITKCTQFPIEMSLPFILTEHVVHNISGSVPLLENVAYILDVYNDAAFWALQTIQAQHLYDELEAEVNLVFDQATFLIGEEMYSHFKNAASSALLDTGYKTAIESGKGYAQLTVEEKRFSAVAEQHHILLLGRSIDLNFLIGTHLNHILLKDVSSVVKRFENSDLSNILEIEAMLQVVELTHTRLSTLLSLDPFEDMLQNANADVNAAHMCGKIVAHMKTTLLEDVVVNYALNMHTQRFVKSPVAFKQTGREGRPKLMQNNLGFGTQCGKAWDFYCNLSRGFVGRPHIEAMVRMVGEAGVNYITAFFMEHIEERINNTKSVLTGLSDGLPPIKLPKVSYVQASELPPTLPLRHPSLPTSTFFFCVAGTEPPAASACSRRGSSSTSRTWTSSTRVSRCSARSATSSRSWACWRRP
jgi:cytoplasmic FMR1 interacting protein